MYQMFVGWGFAPDITGDHKVLPRPSSCIRGLLLREERRGYRTGRKITEMRGEFARDVTAVTTMFVMNRSVIFI